MTNEMGLAARISPVISTSEISDFDRNAVMVYCPLPDRRLAFRAVRNTPPLSDGRTWHRRSLPSGENPMTLPQRQERREFRYPLQLPVLVKMARKEMRTRSENISLRGILLSSAFLIPEGATVDVAVGVNHTSDPGILLNARGKVLRVQPKASGDFAVAIRLDRSFELPRPKPESKRVPEEKAPQRFDGEKNKIMFYPVPCIPAWHTET